MQVFRVRRFAAKGKKAKPLSIHDFHTCLGACECARMIERLGERAMVTYLAGIVPWVSFLKDGTTLVIESEARL